MTIDNNEHQTSSLLYESINGAQMSDMLFYNSNQAMAFFDKDLKLIKLNTAFSSLFGPSGANLELINISYLPISNHTDYNGLMEELKEGRISKFTLDIIFSGLEGENKIIQTSFSSNRVNGAFEGGLISLSDVTQYRLAQKLLEQRNQELELKTKELEHLSGLSEQLQSFAYVASHDLKEPLRTIGNFSQLLQRQSNGYIDDVGREYLSYITDGVKSMNALIDDLLQYSTLDSRNHLNQSVHVPTAIFILTKMNEKEVEQINATVNIGEMPENIIADKAKFRLIWDCLLSNALKYRRKDIPLEINISGKNIKNGWEFSISDNGIGIKEEYFTKIFEMFKKLHGKKDYQGTGIGLALCKKIVEQHKGNIYVNSKENEGSIFTFTFMEP